MNKRIWKNGLTGLLCIVLFFTNILSVGMEVAATELDSTIFDAVENLNGDNNEDIEEIIENDGQEEDSDLEESDDNGSQNDDDNQETDDFENENEETDNSEEESGEIEDDIDETSNEDDEIIEESEELNEEAEIATVATESEETLSEISGQCGDNLTWVLEDGTLTISGTGDMWDNSSPWSEYADMQLRLVIQDGVTSIGENAFFGCSGFTGNLIIPDSIISIGSQAFWGCSGFTGSLTIPNSVTNIEWNAFSGCSGFTGSLTISESITSIESNSFTNCSGFSGSLKIPDGVTNIGSRAFIGCSGFTGNLIIPNSVTSIKEEAFQGCSGFTGNLRIPDGVTNIESRVFDGCSSFTGGLTIPEGVTNIGRMAFDGCSGFTGSLIIPDSVTSIGDEAFRGCSGFSGNLIISDSVTSIGDETFRGCSGFTGNLKIPEGVTNIGSGAFTECSGFTGNLKIPEGVTSIGSGAFIECSGFTGNLKIPDRVTSIESRVFDGCSGFTGNLTIPENIISVKRWALDECHGLNNVIFKGDAPSIDEFAGNIVVNVYYPSWKSGWDSVVGNDYGGTLTWIPYSEGTSPWENGSTEGTTNFWFVVSTDASDLTYDVANGYNKNQFSFDISLTHLGMETDPESYEDVNMIIELPEGLSFSKDEEIRTTTSILGTIDKTNNKRDISNSVYISGNDKVDKFTITMKVTAKDYETPQTYTYSISVSVKKGEHIVYLSPESGYQYCGLQYITCEIQFDQNIRKWNDGYISLREYDSDNIVEVRDMNEVIIRDNKLSVRFETLLSADAKYYILLDDSAIELEDGTVISGISSKEYWYFNTIPIEYPLMSNPMDIKIESKFYNILGGPQTAQKIREHDDGTNGICFGMSYAVGAWNKGYPAVKSIGKDGITLKDFKFATKGRMDYTFLEYLQLAHLCQFFPSMQRERQNNRDKYDKLYKAVTNYQNNSGSPIIIGVWDQKYSGGHAVLPIGILEEDEYNVKILIYDCNGYGNGYGGLFLTELNLKKHNGQFVGWEFPMYGTKYNNGHISFLEVNSGIDDAIFVSDFAKTPNLVFCENEINFLEEIISCAESMGGGTKKHLYWTDDSAISRAASSNAELSEIGITDGYKEISVSMPLNADVTLDLDSNTAQADFTGISDYSVTYSKAIDDDIHSITVNGKASGSLLAEQTTEGVVLKSESLEDVTVEVKNNDATASKKTFSSEKDSVLVKEENNDIIIYEDSNGDGTYDKRIDSEIEDVTSAYAVAVTVQRDNKIWNEHGRKFALTTDSGATFVSSLDKVPEGNYVVYDVTGMDEGLFGASGVNTGVSVAVKDGDANITVDYYTVTFYDQDTAYGGETFQRPQIVLKGKKALVPTLNPTKSGYNFGGWVTTDGGSQTFNFDTSIVGTTNVYASWTQNESVGYTITASAEEGGSITPNGSVHVNEGENQTFTITPDSGYRLKSIVVDGKEEAADEEKARENSAQQGSIRHYTFSDVRVNHIIRVIFEADNGNTGDSGNTGGNTGDSGNTGDNTGDSGNSGNTSGNTGDSGNSGNTGGSTGDSGNSGNTGGSTGDSGSGGNTGGNGSSSGNNGNTNSSGNDAGDNGGADNSGTNTDGGGNTNATDNVNNSHFSNSGVGNTMNTGNGADNSNGNNKNNGVSSSASGNNGINSKSGSSKDTEPRTEDASHIEIYATIAMITGLLYLVLYFADERGITEEEKNEMVATLVKWAKQGTWIRRYTALILIFFLLAYYHSIGKRTSVEWKAVYEK